MNKKRILYKSINYFSLLAGACLLIAATFFTILFLGGFGKIPSQNELNELKNQTASLVYSNDDQLIGKFFTENRTLIPFDSLPQNLIDALIATEDARFYEHEGVDGKSLMRVLLKTILMGDDRSGGGSTLSQQLAKNLYGRKDYGKITILVNKLKEIILANRLENNYTKDQIIALYFNTVTFGENTYGIEVASHRYFNKNANDLKTEEAAVLVGLLKANTYYNPRLNPGHSLFRRNVVITQMSKYGYLKTALADSLKKLPLKLDYSNLSELKGAAYFLSQVKSESKAIIEAYNKANNTDYEIEKDGLIIKSTLNHQLQMNSIIGMNAHISIMQSLLNRQYATGSFKLELNVLAKKVAERQKLNFTDTSKKVRFIYEWEENEIAKKLTLADSIKHILSQLHAGILGLNPKNGAIRAYVGGINYQHYPYDQVQAKRQMASTFKPFLYATALENGFQACDYLSNEEIVLTDYNDWSPKNYDKESGGEYSLAAALAFSKNIPSLRLFFHVEWEKLNELWNNLGFEDELSQEPSVIYGTNSVSLLELASAYAVFANGGYPIDPYTVESIETKEGEVIYTHQHKRKESVLAKETTQSINEILNMAIREGTGVAIPNRYGIRSDLAGKTGTSQNYADAWFCIYNKELVLATRVGASYPNIHFKGGNYGSGSRLALPILGKTLVAEKKASWLTAGLDKADDIDCPNFKEDTGIDKFLKLFKDKETQLDKERDKSNRKKKRKNFFNKLFGQ